ncbi:PEP-CTERM sorting domain-containing protein [Thalassotalea sp. PLHSN55]|uniref:PEP-CTERM sorting domain-containing protein n=1 Tax=Thalassotalea sp. PLHSN55 TaxID=3435888 RepID=UPI003F8531B1
MNKLLTAAAMALTFAGTAAADPIYIDVGTDFGGNAQVADGPTTTGWKDSLTLRYESESLITDNDFNGLDVGDTIVSKGGLEVGTFLSNRATALVDSQLGPFGPSDNGYGVDWLISFTFDDLMGTFNGTDFNYTSGTIDWLLFTSADGFATGTNLFSTEIKSHVSTPGNQVFSGDVTNVNPAADIFNIAVGGGSQTFSEYAASHTAPVRFRIDQNTDPINPQFVETTAEGHILSIGGTHDASLEFSVPEPATLAMLGLGLLGFGAARRKAK